MGWMKSAGEREEVEGEGVVPTCTHKSTFT